jgi:Sel1 repeat
MKNIACVLAIIFLAGCVAHKKSKSVSKSDDKNNVLSVTKSGIVKTSGGDKVIFDGSNNLFELIQHNAIYFDKSHDVIIVKGDGCIIKLYNINIVDMRDKGTDTLVLVGNKVKYVMVVKDEIALKKPINKPDTVEMKYKVFEAKKYEKDFDDNESKWNVTKELFVKIKNNDAHAYYELADVYNYGIEGVPVSTDKAVDLYEYGAVRNDIQSIRRLGDIWFNGTFDKSPDKIKGRYYYKLGAQLGDSYCLEMLANN